MFSRTFFEKKSNRFTLTENNIFDINFNNGMKGMTIRISPVGTYVIKNRESHFTTFNSYFSFNYCCKNYIKH